MADITAHLVWYKLGEAWASADILDVIFLGWCAFGLAVVLLAALLPNRDCWSGTALALGLSWLAWARAFYRRLGLTGSNASPMTTGADGLTTAAADGETCRWLNTLVTWYFLNRGAVDQTDGSGGGGDDFVNAWLRALNQAMERREGPKEKAIVFEELLVGSLPPKILYATAKHCDDTHNLAINLRVQAEELRMKILLPNSPNRRNCEVMLTDVNCCVQAELRLCRRGFNGSLRLAELPEGCASVRLLPGAPAAAAAAENSDDWIGRQVVAAIAAAVTEISTAPAGETAATTAATAAVSADGDASIDAAATSSPPPTPLPTTPPPRPPPPTRTSVSSSTSSAARPPPSPLQHQQQQPISPIVTPIDYELASSALRPLALTPAGNSGNGGVGGDGRRLLVKVVKAGGLHGAVSSFRGVPSHRPAAQLLTRAIVELDKPQQRHETGGVYGSTNPYWDQHFVFSLSPESTSLSIRVLHQLAANGAGSEELLGAAALPLSLLPPTGARVLQPLRPPGLWPASPSGQPLPSITLELLFVAEPVHREALRTGEEELAPVVAGTEKQIGSFTPSSSGVVSSSGSLSPADALAPPPAPPPPTVEVTPAAEVAATGEASLRSSSLSRVVDEFMTSPDISYQLSSFSESTLNGESRAMSSTELEDQVFDSNIRPDYTEFSSLGRKPKGQKPGRTGSVASRIKRVFSGRSKRHPAAESSSTVLDQDVLSAPNALRLGDGGPSGPNGDGTGPPHQASPLGPPELSKSRARGLSASFRRLFSGAKRKNRRTSESADSEQQTRQQKQAMPAAPPPTFYSLQKPGKPPRIRPWDSDEIL
ncbi:hypothetical protein BOX15_Mlig025280g1 [Macrostomum lignano]|uniref:C2 domain-containing protein n=2 Tax=Macrostomum lignano TaxID=282301 RepID=A0A1I8GW42_9PLAT|nr:hypothetical protein BOX15_Mlig025280g1 [Macrostomum lignano]